MYVCNIVDAMRRRQALISAVESTMSVPVLAQPADSDITHTAQDLQARAFLPSFYPAVRNRLTMHESSGSVRVTGRPTRS